MAWSLPFLGLAPLLLLLACSAGGAINSVEAAALDAFNPLYDYTPSDIVHTSTLSPSTQMACRWHTVVNGTNTFASILAVAPYSWVTPHFHPNAYEYNFILQGELMWLAKPDLEAGLGHPELINGTTLPGQLHVMPQGLVHTLYNPTCSYAVMYHAFSDASPVFSFVGLTLFNTTPPEWRQVALTGARTLNEPDHIHAVNQECVRACGLDRVFMHVCSPTASGTNMADTANNFG